MQNINFEKMELPQEFNFRKNGGIIPYYACRENNEYRVYWINYKGEKASSVYSLPLVAENIESGFWKIYQPTLEEVAQNKQEDIINKPNHYHKNEIDVNGYLEKHFPKEANVTVVEGFYIGNIIKYVSRHKEKNGMQDLEKAMFNLKKLMEWREKNG